jgi:hypothetical protein
MERATTLEERIWERFSHPDAPADTALGLAERFEVTEEEALAALAALVRAGRLGTLTVGRLAVFCRTERRPAILDRWYVSEPTLWRRSQTPARRPDAASPPSVAPAAGVADAADIAPAGDIAAGPLE